MITPAYVRTMAAYNAEMNRRLYAAAGRLTDDERHAEGGAFWHSIHGTLNHLYWADQMWMSRFDGWEKPSIPGSESYRFVADFDALSERRIAADAALLEWADRVDAAWLAGDTTWFSGIAQRNMSAKTAFLVMHLFNHQTHHRGQAHALVTRAGEKTGDTDLWLVLNG